MKKEVVAVLHWSDEKYGRKFSVTQDWKYCPIIKFEDQPASTDLWSAIIYLVRQQHDGSLFARLTYFSDCAPFELLYSGHRFELFEGARKVANGVVLGDYTGEESNTTSV